MAMGRVFLVACFASTFLCSVGRTKAETPSYSVTGHLSGTGSSWDYAVIDPASARLYLAQAGVTAVDLATDKVTSGFVSKNSLREGKLATSARLGNANPRLCRHKLPIIT